MATFVLGITDAAQIQAMDRQMVAQYPALHVVINNTGIMPFDDVGGGRIHERRTTWQNQLLSPRSVPCAC